MSTFLRKINLLFSMMAKGYHKQILKKIYSNENKSLILRIDLENELVKPRSEIVVTLRLYEKSDYKFFPDTENDDFLLSLDIPTCYVALTPEGVPFYRQWLFHKPDEKKFRQVFGDYLIMPNENEAMLERVYVVPEYRGKFIGPQAAYLMSLKVKELGVRWIITSIYLSNTRALRASRLVGFKPYKIQQVKYRFFKRTIVYNELPDDFYEKSEIFKK